MPFFSFLIKLILLGLLTIFHPAITEWLTAVGIRQNVAEVLVSFTSFLLGLSLIMGALSFIYRRRKKLVRGTSDNVLIGLDNIYYLILAGGIIMAILGLFGIDYRTLFTTLSIVAAAIAIISKDYISEIISGIIISFSKEVAIGDYVKISDQKGRVADIALTKIALLNDDDDVIFLPNNKVFSSEIVNYTRRQIRKVSIDFELDLQFIQTVEELETALIHALADYDEYIESKSYNLKIVEIRKDSLALKFQYIFHKIDPQLEREIRRTTSRRIINFIQSKRIDTVENDV